MKRADLIRYGLLAGVALTANANRRHYRMTTTWLPHLAMNTFALLLPDLYRGVSPYVRGITEHTPDSPVHEARTILLGVLDTLVRDNPAYVAYVVPLAVGYLTSHPDFNIYKGKWGEMQFLGFGFDAIPHSATAFALTKVIYDVAHQSASSAPQEGVFVAPLCWCDQKAGLLSAVVLALITAWWEVGEYLIHRHELEQRGDADSINMQWSLSDTLTDCLSNAGGWALAVLWQQNRLASTRHALVNK